MNNIEIGTSFKIKELDFLSGSFIKERIYEVYSDNIKLTFYNNSLGYFGFYKIEYVNMERSDILALSVQVYQSIQDKKDEFIFTVAL